MTFRYLWESSSGRDLDTMTEALNSNVPTIDNLAVGWSEILEMEIALLEKFLNGVVIIPVLVRNVFGCR